VAAGRHENITSPLLGDDIWVSEKRRLGVDWGDCEVGLMALEANSRDMKFAYLHVVSDNVISDQLYGLWNERCEEVQRLRLVLFEEVNAILRRHFSLAAKAI
jgi:hypothetical protein